MKRKLFLASVSIEHFCIDLLCIYTLSNLVRSGTFSLDAIIVIYFLYNLIAFGTQFIWGYLLDKYRLEKYILVASGLIVIVGFILLNFSQLAAVIIIALGNALFHVSAGSIVLQSFKNKYAPIGIFIAPGAIGVLLGSYSMSAGIGWGIPIGLVIIILSVIVFALNKKLKSSALATPAKPIRLGPILIILAAIALRAFVGSVTIFPWKSAVDLLWLLTIAVAFGKAIGGIIADKIGWSKVVTISIIIAIPMLIFNTLPILGIIGSLLLNITTAITVILLFKELPNMPSLTFGLTCLALLIGGIPVYFPAVKSFFNNSAYAPIGLLLTLIIFIIFYKKYNNHEK